MKPYGMKAYPNSGVIGVSVVTVYLPYLKPLLINETSDLHNAYYTVKIVQILGVLP